MAYAFQRASNIEDDELDDLKAGRFVKPSYYEKWLYELGCDPSTDESQFLHIHHRLAISLWKEGRFAEADNLFLSLLPASGTLLGTCHELTARLVYYCCLNKLETDDYTGAEAVISSVDKDLSATPADENTIAKDIVAMTLGVVTAAKSRYVRRTDINLADDLEKKALKSLDDLLKRWEIQRWYLDEDLLKVMKELGTLYSNTDPEKSLKLEQELLERRLEKMFGKLNSDVRQAYLDCARRYAQVEQYDNAEHLLRESIQKVETEAAFEDGSPDAVAIFVQSLGQLLEFCGRNEEARDLGLQYLELLKAENLLLPGAPPSFNPGAAPWLPHRRSGHFLGQT